MKKKKRELNECSILNLSSLSYLGKASEAEEGGDADGNDVSVLVLPTGHLMLLPGHQPAKPSHEIRTDFSLHKLYDLGNDQVHAVLRIRIRLNRNKSTSWILIHKFLITGLDPVPALGPYYLSKI